MPPSRVQYDIPALMILLGITTVIIIFWDFVGFYPLKLFTVLLHEISHGLAAMLTGGRFLKLEISPELGGVATTAGGWRILVISAGYLGSMLWGSLIVILASRMKNDKLISLIIGGLIIFLTVFFVRGLFGFIFSALFGAALILIGLLAPAIVNDIALKVIGLSSILYAITDIKSDLISHTIEGSDAWALSRILILPPVVWGILWMALAAAAAFFSLRYAVRQENSAMSRYPQA